MDFKVSQKEKVFFILKVIFSIPGIFVAISMFCLPSLSTRQNYDQGIYSNPFNMLTIFILYTLLIIIWIIFRKIIMIGHLKGNGIEINNEQFPLIDEKIKNICLKFNIKKIPKVFIVQSGGILNAYATRFSGNDFVAIYSDIFNLHDEDPDVVEFIIAHELAHVKRKHVQKKFWTLLSFYVPFLGQAYSRACERTCDSFASQITKVGAIEGITMLASGVKLYKKINTKKFLSDAIKNRTFSVSFYEVFSSHPTLPNRIIYLRNNGLIE